MTTPGHTGLFKNKEFDITLVTPPQLQNKNKTSHNYPCMCHIAASGWKSGVGTCLHGVDAFIETIMVTLNKECIAHVGSIVIQMNSDKIFHLLVALQESIYKRLFHLSKIL